MPKLIRQGVVLGVAALAAVTAACAPGSGNDAAPATKAPSAVNTDIAKAGNVTLTVWDQEIRGGQNEQMEQLNTAFQQKYPNVTIKRVARSFPDLQKTLRLALSGDSPPDVVETNQGYAVMGAFVKAGMLLPLDSYDAAYGWRKRYPKGLIETNSVSTDGRTLGTGSLYGVSLQGEIVGIYYNKDKLAKLGIQEPPTTWVEFEKVLFIAKDAGELPIAFGNLDKFPAIHNFGVIQDQIAGKDAVRDLFFGRGGTWTDAANVQAAQKLLYWVKQGYLTKNPNAVKYDDSPVNFGKGEGVFLIGGTWFAVDLEKTMGDKVGFMLPPPAQAGGASVTMGGQSLPFSITSKSKHPDVAAAYVNFITSPESMDIATEKGLLPALKPPSKQPESALQKEIFAAWDAVSRSDGLTPYLDNATPTFPDTLGGALQELVGGKATPQEALEKAQKDYADFLQKK
ncbi:extracellular solute-binding protein [Actinomadura alba]|uniref:Extracellular solute-binding protein n=1 Tax=Actinomadura alba TaxID=406431 RepID=A0ABR7LYF6_9ACTN|nr:extracellular solute-binding protein [Actinomadura alba]MBC6469894.1 extracellular solute-binding protein [Actinomadura alba]